MLGRRACRLTSIYRFQGERTDSIEMQEHAGEFFVLVISMMGGVEVHKYMCS